MSANPELLEALFGEAAAEEFLSDYWPDRIYVAHGDKDRLPAPFLDSDLNDFDALSRRYKGVVSFFGDAKSDHMVPVDGLEAAAPYRCGLSVYLADIGPFFPEIHALVRVLEAELGVNEGCARAGVFASPTKGGISCHYDSVGVFSIQLRGTKKFDLAPVGDLRYPSGFQYITGNRPIDDLYPQATAGFPSWENAEFQTVEMWPGTVLYMPCGTWHRTEAAGDSISVSIGMEPPSAAQCVLEQMRLLMLQDPEWRKPLYGAWGVGAMRESAQARAAELIARLPSLTAALEPELLAMPLTAERRRIPDMTPKSWVQRTPNTSLSIGDPPADTTEEDSLLASIETRDRSTTKMTAQIEMPSSCAPMLRWIDAKAEAFQIEELAREFPELSEAHHVQLVRSLTEAGFVKLYWFPKLNSADDRS